MDLSDPTRFLGKKAWPALCGRADIKTLNEDFQVDEKLAFEPAGMGEHVYLRVKKDGENTAFVSRSLARYFGVDDRGVSYAGMKDRHAITSQWFSVHLPQTDTPAQNAMELGALNGDGLENVELLAHTRHHKKLRRGQIDGNTFNIVLRGFSAERTATLQRLELISQHGFPNYFGAQRFGRDNVQSALQWMKVSRSRRTSGFKKSLYISVLRSLLFNIVLCARVEHNNWNALIDGDVAQSNYPTGTLWGRGSSLLHGDAGALEHAAIAPYIELLDALEHVGLKKELRHLVAIPDRMEWEFTDNTLGLKFTLSQGVYATSLLREIAHIQDANPYADNSDTRGAEAV